LALREDRWGQRLWPGWRPRLFLGYEGLQTAMPILAQPVGTRVPMDRAMGGGLLATRDRTGFEPHAQV
jgi:hypothetical protein